MTIETCNSNAKVNEILKIFVYIAQRSKLWSKCWNNNFKSEPDSNCRIGVMCWENKYLRKSQSPDTVLKIWGSLHSKMIWARLIFKCKFCSPSKLSLPYERTFLIHWAKFFLVPYLCKKFACEWKKELFQSLHRLKSSVNHIIKSRTNSILYSFLYSNRGKYNWINPFSK